MIDFVSIIYAIVVAAGGIVGYVKAGSVPSIIAGLIFGILIGVGAYFTSQDPPQPLILLIVTIVLGGFMGFRWAKSGNFMPSGLITILSIAVLIYALIIFRKNLPFVN